MFRQEENRAMRRRPALLSACIVGAALVLSACGPQKGSNPAPVENKGTDPTIGAKRAGANTLNNAVVAKPDSNGIITYDGYQSAVARNGDTVAKVAERVGLSASELGAYNGLSASHALRQSDELILPPRPGGFGPNGNRAAITAPAGTTAVTTVAAAPSTIEQAPLTDTGAEEATAEEVAAATETATEAPSASANASTGWSPDLAAAAIERSTGLQGDGTLAAPPSANEPTPPEPAKRRQLDSPKLGQYQTEASVGSVAPPPRPDAGATAAGSPSQSDDEQEIAAANAAPAAPTLRLTRPVQGEVAIGFNKGAGPSRNDGVDFAARAGSPVVAAADGEVALVSQSLSGLGTIILVRHPDEYLTVYGRVDGVSVKKGDTVRSGQRIGVVSNAGAPAEPRMHFEVRRGAESLDPMLFLPS